MTAKEMFNDLGYELIENGERLTHYRKKLDNHDFLNVEFNSAGKFCHCTHMIVKPFDVVALEVDVGLHKAIDKQIKELGWLNG